MSKRSEKKERLARDLDAGKITREQYDFQIGRMRTRGAPSREKYQQARQERRPLQRDGKSEWKPQAQSAPPVAPAPEMHTLTVWIDDLTFRRIMRAMVVAGIEDIGAALGKLLETLPPEK